MKKITAFLLSLVICLNFSACVNSENSWAMKDGDNTLSIGSYIYYNFIALNQATNLVSKDTEVLLAAIDEIPASQYIKNQALDYSLMYFFVDRKMKELNISLTEEEKANAQSVTTSQLQTIGDTLEQYGVSDESFHNVYSLYNFNYSKLFQNLYTKGGEFEVSDQELREYYTKNNYGYNFMFISLMKLDEDNQSVACSEEEIEEINATAQKYIELAKSGESSLEECAELYAKDAGLDTAPYNSFVNSKDYYGYPDGFLENLEKMENGDFVSFETNSLLVILEKVDMEIKADEMFEDETTYLNSLMNYKGLDFNEYILDEARKMEGIEFNTSAMNKIDLEDYVTDYNKYGMIE